MSDEVGAVGAYFVTEKEMMTFLDAAWEKCVIAFIESRVNAGVTIGTAYTEAEDDFPVLSRNEIVAIWLRHRGLA